MPRNREFSRAVILDSLPGTSAEIAKRSGFTDDTVRRAVADLIAQGKAYQSGWHKAGNYVPVYAKGPIPAGFELAPKPAGESPSVRDARYRAKPKGKAKAAALARKSYARRIDAERERNRAAWQANRDRINASRRAKREAERKAEAARVNAFGLLLQTQLIKDE